VGCSSSAGGEFLRHVLQEGLRHLTASDEPASSLRQRDPSRATLTSTPRQSHHRAERHQPGFAIWTHLLPRFTQEPAFLAGVPRLWPGPFTSQNENVG